MRERLLRRLATDIWGICRIIGPAHAVRWVLAIAEHWREIAKDRNLLPADQAMGHGPFLVRKSPACKPFWITGAAAFSGIREMYVRDSYLQDGALSIADGSLVLDLGANMGNFTNLALAHGKRVRVVAVEPNSALEERFWTSVCLNEGFRERTTFIRAFLGAPGHKQEDMMRSNVYTGAPFLTDHDLLEMAGLSHVNFLKCDIEGGEFSFFGNNSPLLAMTDQLAIEVHAFAGDVDAFVKRLLAAGFKVKHQKVDPDGTRTLLAGRRDFTALQPGSSPVEQCVLPRQRGA
jgi:FkbM family methyltransferase